MNKIKAFLIVFAIAINFNLFGKTINDTLQLPYYPKYKEVVLKFLKDYSATDAQLYPNQFSLVKKPDGWHAMVKDYQKNEIKKDELFWDRQKNEYLTVDFPESIFENAAKELEYRPTGATRVGTRM